MLNQAVICIYEIQTYAISPRLAHSRLVALVCEGRNSCFVNDRVYNHDRGANNYYSDIKNNKHEMAYGY